MNKNMKKKIDKLIKKGFSFVNRLTELRQIKALYPNMTILLAENVCFFDIFHNKEISFHSIFKSDTKNTIGKVQIDNGYQLAFIDDGHGKGRFACLENAVNIEDQVFNFKWAFIKLVNKSDSVVICHPDHSIEGGYLDIEKINEIMIKASVERILLPYFYWYILYQNDPGLFHSLSTIEYRPNPDYAISFMDIIDSIPVHSNNGNFEILL